MISEFKIFPVMLLTQLNFDMFFVGLTAILRLLQLKNASFFNLYFHSCLVKEGLAPKVA